MAHLPIIRNTQAFVRNLMEHNVIASPVELAEGEDPNTAGPATVDFPSGSPLGMGVTGPGSTIINITNGDTYVNVGTLAVPVWTLQGMALAPVNTQWLGLRAGSIPTGSSGTPGIMQPFGVSNPGVAGAADGDNDQVDGTYIRFSTAAAGGSAAGLTSNREGPQVRHNPELTWQIRTDADISSIRFWIGLTTNGWANVDDVGGSSEYVAVRYSTVAADPGFMAVTRNGTSQTVHGKIADIAINTAYEIKISGDGAGKNWVFSINGQGLAVVSDPGLGTATKFIPIAATIITQVAAARRFLAKSMFCQY